MLSHADFPIRPNPLLLIPSFLICTLIIVRCLMFSILMQFKGHTNACCGSKSFSWVDSRGKGCYFFLIFVFWKWHEWKEGHCERSFLLFGSDFLLSIQNWVDFLLDSSLSHVGNDSKPRLCISRYNDTGFSAYDAWWEILTSSCGRQRWHLFFQFCRQSPKSYLFVLTTECWLLLFMQMGM